MDTVQPAVPYIVREAHPGKKSQDRNVTKQKGLSVKLFQRGLMMKAKNIFGHHNSTPTIISLLSCIDASFYYPHCNTTNGLQTRKICTAIFHH